MSHRMTLTLIWLLGLVICLVLVEMYFRLTVDGIPFLFPEDTRGKYLKPVSTIYSIHIAGILGAWFIRRFRPPSKDPDAKILFIIAILCTLIWNIGVIYLVGQRHIWPYQGGTLVADLDIAVQFGTWFSFLVLPVNVYYFGIKSKNVE